MILLASLVLLDKSDEVEKEAEKISTQKINTNDNDLIYKIESLLYTIADKILDSFIEVENDYSTLNHEDIGYFYKEKKWNHSWGIV